MTQLIEAPNGEVIEFPDNMGDEEITAVLRKEFGGPEPATPTPARDETRDNILAATGGAIEGIPIIGGPLREGLNKAGALKRSLLNDTTYSQELEAMRAEHARLKQDNPIISGASQLAGGVAALGPVGMTGVGAKALGLAGKSLGTRSAASAASGAAIGGADAATRGQDIASGAGVGAAFGGIAPAAGMAIGGAGRALLGKKAPLRDIQAIKAVKDNAYKQADAMGATYASGQFNLLIHGIENELKNAKLHAARHPRAASMLEDLRNARGKPMTMTELDQWRQVVARDVASVPDRSERALGKKMIEQIDNFMESATPAATAPGVAPQAVGPVIRQARSAHQRLRKAELIEETITKAVRRAESTGSGGNVQNAIRQNIRGILENPKKLRGFTKEEKDIMEQIVSGTKPENFARLVGKLSPSGNGLMAALGLGATVANPMMAAAPGVGIVAKRLADNATTARADSLQNLVRGGTQRGPAQGIGTQLLLKAPVVQEPFRTLAPPLYPPVASSR